MLYKCSEIKIAKLEKVKLTHGKVKVIIFDELYFYGKEFLSYVGIQDLANLVAIEKAKEEFINNLLKQQVFVIVAGATENPKIYDIAANRNAKKLSRC